MIARVLIWNLFDSKTTLDELRAQLPALPDGDVWVANEVQDRFGVKVDERDMPGLGRLGDLAAYVADRGGVAHAA